MGHVLNKLAVASQRAPGLRSFQFLNSNDQHKLEAFFLSFDFDQRRAYFGGGISDQSVRNYCGTIDWDHTTAIARTGPYCPEAIALVVSLLSNAACAELSIACPLLCDQRPIVAALLDLAIEIGSLQHRTLIVNRELANPELLSLLHDSELARFDREHVEIDLAAGHSIAAAPLFAVKATETSL
jgi:hypothetical protein